METKKLRKLIKEELLKEQILCHLVSPKGNGEGGYIPNEEALNLIDRIEDGGKKEIKDPSKLKQFIKTIQQFRQDIDGIDTNNDTVNTYLHKLRDLVGCYSL